MAVNLSALAGAGQQFFDNSGVILSGGKLYSYAAGTTTPQTTYTSASGSTAHTNPIILNSAGRVATGEIWLTAGSNYKFALYTSTDVLITTWDNITGINGTGITSNASNVTYDPAGTNVVATTVQAKLRESVSVKDFGAVGDGNASAGTGTDNRQFIQNAYDYCVTNGKDLFIPAGSYRIVGRVIWGENVAVTSTCFNCNNVTVYGEGDNTILWTDYGTGADVININNAKNLTVRDLAVTSRITNTTGAGSNAVSITNGFDNLTIERIHAINLPYVNKTTYLDGGKGITFQTTGAVGILGTARVINCIADGCVYGFDFSLTVEQLIGQPCVITVTNMISQNCWFGYIVSAPAPASAIPAGFNCGISISGVAINCQHGLFLSRVYGGRFDIEITNTKTKANLLLDPNGTAWSATLNPYVESFVSTYAHNCAVQVTGYANNVDYKARIGGALAGSSGLNGATYWCNMYLDINGTADIADILEVNSGGNYMRLSNLVITTGTSATIPAIFYTSTYLNQLQIIGSYGTALLPGNIQFPASQISSTDVNCLDDYEEGSFIPILADTNLADEGATYSTNIGYYTKIGNRVYFNLTMVVTGLGTLTGGSSAFILNLPYSSRLASGNTSSCVVSNVSGIAMSAAGVMGASVGANFTYIALRKTLATSTTGDVAMTVTEVSATGSFVISGSYNTPT